MESDASPDAGPRGCDPASDYGNARLVPGLGEKLQALRPGAQQWLDATLSDDERFMMFSACDNGTNNAAPTCDIYQATLEAGTVSSVQRVDGLSSATDFDRHPTLSADLLRVFFIRPAGIFTASRPDRLGTFGTPSAVASLDFPGPPRDTDPFLGRSGTLYFMRGAPRSVYYAIVGDSGITSAQQLSASLSGNLLDPVMADVGNQPESLLFLATIVRDAGGTDHRIMRTTERTGATWSTLSDRYVSGLNVAGTSNFANWTSADSCRLYFSRGTGVGAGFQIYVAERAPR